MEIQIYDEIGYLTKDQETLVIDLLRFSSKKLNLKEDTEMSITFLDNNRIKEINKKYRNKDQATDVISFAINESIEEEFDAIDLTAVFDVPHELGDLFISIEKMKDQAEEYGHSELRELGFLLVHGFLHLNGYDHQTKEEEKEMFSFQEDILREFGLRR